MNPEFVLPGLAYRQLYRRPNPLLIPRIPVVIRYRPHEQLYKWCETTFLQNLQADNERILKEARAERDGLLKEAREIKQKMIDDAKDEAKTQAAQIMTQAQAAIESEKQAAVAELKQQVASLSIEIAEKVTKETLADDKKQSQLVQKLLKDVNL